MRLFLTLLAVMAVPTIAFFSSAYPYMQGGITNPIEIGMYMTQCVMNGGQNSKDIAVNCQGGLVQDAIGVTAMAAAALGLILMGIVAVAGMVASANRDLLPFAFKSSTFFSILVMSVIVLIQAGLIFAVLMGVMFLIGLVFPAVLIGAAVGVIVLVFSVLSGLFGMFKELVHQEHAVLLTPESASPIYALIDDITKSSDLKKPDNVIAGLQPNFYAVSTKVNLSTQNEPLSGETLYASLPLLRVMNVDEVRSIIGHELGHFSGQDTEYSIKFAPAYSGLAEVQTNLVGHRNLFAAIGSLPVHTMINYIFSIFEPIVAKISREREFRADRIGASVGSPEALSTSLVKLTALSQIWNAELSDLVERLQRHRQARNLALNFVERSRYDTDHDYMHELTNRSLEDHVPHPVDSHPATKLRLEAMGIDPRPLLDSDAFKASLLPGDTLAAQWPELEFLEEKLTTNYQDFLRPFVGVFDTIEDRVIAKRYSMASLWLARMVLADGDTDPVEIRVGQTSAMDAGLQFDASLFRELCREGTTFPEVEEMLAQSNILFSAAQADQLKGVLRSIADADGVMHPSEHALLEAVEAGLVGGAKASSDEVHSMLGIAKPKSTYRRRRR